jgi:hypothetical protein
VERPLAPSAAFSCSSRGSSSFPKAWRAAPPPPATRKHGSQAEVLALDREVLHQVGANAIEPLLLPSSEVGNLADRGKRALRALSRCQQGRALVRGALHDRDDVESRSASTVRTRRLNRVARLNGRGRTIPIERAKQGNSTVSKTPVTICFKWRTKRRRLGLCTPPGWRMILSPICGYPGRLWPSLGGNDSRVFLSGESEC